MKKLHMVLHILVWLLAVLGPAALLVACCDTIEEDTCGDPPSMPGWSTSFDDGARVCLSRSDFMGLENYAFAMRLWAICKTGMER